jgi:hypothetical protein
MILKDHDEQLERVAQGLLEMETLDKEQFEALYLGTASATELKEDQIAKDAAQKAADEAEAARKKAEQEKAENKIEQALSEGKRVAVINKDGRIVLKTNEKPAVKTGLPTFDDQAQPKEDVPSDKEDNNDTKEE